MTAPPPIVSDRLVLRVPEVSDAEALMRVFGDPEAMRFIGDGSVRTIDRVRESIDRKREVYRELGVSMFTVERRDTGAIIGDCGLIPIAFAGPEFELGYRFAPEAWGKGYATEAARAALTHAWGVLDVDTVVGVTHPENTTSGRVLAKLGFVDRGLTPRWYSMTLRWYETTRPSVPACP